MMCDDATRTQGLGPAAPPAAPHRAVAALLAALALLAAPTAAAGARAELGSPAGPAGLAVLAGPPVLAGPAAPVGRDGVRRAERWPEPRSRQQIEIDVLRLRRASTEGMEQGAREGLAAEGAAAVPALLEALRRERDPGARRRVESMLEQLTGAAHTRLLAQRFDDPTAAVRTFALGRVARFPDPGVRVAAEAARARAVKALEAPRLADEERALLREELYRASLCCASAGSLVGLGELKARARSHWARAGDELRTALAAVRGAEASALLVPDLASDDRATVVAALNLLAACGDPEETPLHVRPLLDHTDNTVRVAAINALRGIVDGAPPLERLPVFEAIEQANAWKKRL